MLFPQAVFDPFPYLGNFRIIESIKCAYEISSDPSDPLELNTLTDLSIYAPYFALIHLSSIFHKNRPMTT